MKVKVIIEAVLDTEDITDNRGVKLAIERTAFNQTNDNLAKAWAVDEIAKRGYERTITLELL